MALFDSGGTFSKVLAGLYDVARGTFSAVADFDSAVSEIEQAREQASPARAQLVTMASEDGGVTTSGAAFGLPSTVGGIDTQTLLLVGAGALVLFLLLRR